jgi:hypothetical protein
VTGLLFVDSNKPAVCKDGPLRLRGGGIRVVGMGNSDVEFGHAQGRGVPGVVGAAAALAAR